MRGVLGAVVVAAFALTACGGGDSTDPGGGGPGPGPGPTCPNNTTSSVTIADDSFSPNCTTVAVNTTITWTWTGVNTHNVTFSTGPNATDRSSGTFQRQFTTAGTFNYQCTNHVGMTARIIVQ